MKSAAALPCRCSIHHAKKKLTLFARAIYLNKQENYRVEEDKKRAATL